MYYNIADFSLHDFTGGLEDIEQRSLNLIGDPVQRYREDPVRMLRAVRFAAKLDLEIHAHSAQPILKMGSLLQEIPAARLFDESLKLFLNGHAHKTWQLLLHYQLLPYLFPTLNHTFQTPTNLAFIEHSLIATDTRIQQQNPRMPLFYMHAFMACVNKSTSLRITTTPF